MNDNFKEINERKKNTQQPKRLRNIENTTGDTNIGSSGQSKALQILSSLSARILDKSSEDNESEASIDYNCIDELADLHFKKTGKRAASDENLQEQTKIQKKDTSSHFKESHLDSESALEITKINDNNTSSENRSLDKADDFSQYQYSYTKKEAEAKEIIDNLQTLERGSLSNNIKALISKIKLDIYKKCDTLESYLDTNQYSTNHTEAWKTLQQLSELTEIKGKEFIECLNLHKEYQDNYEAIKYFTDDEIKKVKEQQDLAEDSQKQRIKDFISIIRQEFQNIKQDPIDTSFNLKLPIEKITEACQEMVTEASNELNEFSTLITESSNNFTNYLKSYQEYQNDYKIHEDLTSARIDELKTWKNHMKEEHIQKIENFITTIEQEFQAIKQDPIDTEANMTTLIDQITEKYDNQLIRAAHELNEFSTLITDFYDNFTDELKLTQIKELPMDILKSEIQLLKLQASPWGDSTAQELYNFLPSLQLINEYSDNQFDIRYNKQILEIRKNISKKYLNEKTPIDTLGFPTTKNAPNIIKSTLHKINFPSDIPTNTPKREEKEKVNLSPDTPKNKGKEKVGLEQQEKKEHIIYILNELKKCQNGNTIKQMSDGARGIYQLWYNEHKKDNKNQTFVDHFKTMETTVKNLRDFIISHDSTKSWPDDAIANLEKIREGLNKRRKTTNKLTKDFQDQIEAFSNKFTEQRQQQNRNNP